MAVSQVGDVIRLAMQELEVLAAGDNPSTQDYSDGVDWLNVMLSNMEADESLSMRPNLYSDSFSTVVGTASYTAGTSGTAFTYRPIRIVNAYSVYQGVSRLLFVQGKADYNRITTKAVTGLPCTLYYVPSQVAVIYFDRVPDAVYTINCDMQVPVGNYADQNTLLAVSPEYRAFMIYNLCIPLSSVFKANLKPSTVALAKITRERIQVQTHNAQFIEPVPSSNLIV